MEGDLIRINEWLLPLSWFYGIGMGLRNFLFEVGVLKSQQYDIPIINVGNITVGGTGKTPHVEYLIKLLSHQHKVAVLSRGYKRKSRGYVLATSDTPVKQIGDEPWQMKQKFPHVHIAVDESRRRGIERLCSDEATKDVEVILLDDAYQHRYVKPSINILLVDYHRMITEDALLPAGRLRENANEKNRANIIVVTKCPYDITPMGFRVLLSSLQPKPYQQIFFSTFRYGELRQAFGEERIPLENLRKENTHALLLTGIGNPQQMEQDLRRYIQHITTLTYPDHHFFTKKDVKEINQAIEKLSRPRIIITTEKDMTRLKGLDGLSQEARQCIYVLPIEVEIMRNEANKFNRTISDYVLKNS